MRGDGRIYLRSKIYWIAFYGPDQDGHVRKICESSHSRRESDAKQLLRRRVREVGNHRAGIRRFQGPAAERITVAELIDALLVEYERQHIKSLEHMRGRSKRVKAFFGFRRAIVVTSRVIRAYIQQRRDESAAVATVNRELSLLRRAYKFANSDREDEGFHFQPVFPKGLAGEEDNARCQFFEPDQVQRIIDHLDPVMAEVTRFCFLTGWRASEIRLLTWNRVRRDTTTGAVLSVELTTSKNGKPRLIGVGTELATLFERRDRARTFTKADGTIGISEYVFHAGGSPLSASVFEKRWAAARHAAGLDGFLFHSLRRTYARNAVDAGIHEKDIRDTAGWLTRSVFDRYNIRSVSNTAAAQNRLTEFLKNQPSKVTTIRKAASDTNGYKTGTI